MESLKRDSEITAKQAAMETRGQFREEIEKNKLSYFIALKYDKDRKKLVFDRHITLTPLPSKVFDELDPAAESVVMVIDYDPDLPIPQESYYIYYSVFTKR